MDWNETAAGFNFEIGEIVKRRGRAEGDVGVILGRVLEDDGGTEPHRLYAISFTTLMASGATRQLVCEVELEYAMAKATPSPHYCPECYKKIMAAKDGEFVKVCDKCSKQ